MNPLKSESIRLLSLALLLWMVACSTSAPTNVTTNGPEDSFDLIQEIAVTDGGWSSVRWSPNSDQLLLINPYLETVPDDMPHNGLLAIVNVADRSLIELPQTGVDAIWSPNGDTILIRSVAEENDTQEDQFWLYAIHEKKTFAVSGLSGSPQSWLADGVLIYQNDQGLWSATLNLPQADSETITVTGATSLLKFEFYKEGMHWASPSPLLNSIVLYDGTDNNDRQWWLVQPDGDRVNLARPFYSIGTCCLWARNGQQFAFFSLMPELGLYIVDSNGENLRQVIGADDIGTGAFISMDFSPDSQTIAFEWSMEGQGFPFGNTQIYSINSDGSGLRNLTPNTAPHRWLRWSPDGKYIAYLGEEHIVWIAQVIRSNP